MPAPILPQRFKLLLDLFNKLPPVIVRLILNPNHNLKMFKWETRKASNIGEIRKELFLLDEGGGVAANME